MTTGLLTDVRCAFRADDVVVIVDFMPPLSAGRSSSTSSSDSTAAVEATLVRIREGLHFRTVSSAHWDRLLATADGRLMRVVRGGFIIAYGAAAPRRRRAAAGEQAWTLLTCIAIMHVRRAWASLLYAQQQPPNSMHASQPLHAVW